MALSIRNERMRYRILIKYFKYLVYYFRYIIFVVVAIYGFVILIDGYINYEVIRKKFQENRIPLIKLGNDQRRKEEAIVNKELYQTSSVENEKRGNTAKQTSPISLGKIIAENILGEDPEEIRQRMIPPNNVAGKRAKIIALGSGITDISNDNMGGCKEWNCVIRSKNFASNEVIEAIVTNTDDEFYRRNSSQYYVFFTQESAANYVVNDQSFNFSLNFFRNSPTSSPYGYTVKLAEVSQLRNSPIDNEIIRNKSLAIAWFASNCNTASKREDYVSYLQRYVTVDVFGICGNRFCDHGGSCENMLDNVYYFYLALENSVCRDYITEKLWKHGYQHDIVPIVLKRSIVERYVPPHSFIAIDDFQNVRELANYLIYLMHNASAYKEFFEWRREYKVVFLDGTHHDQLERPWGFCQLCRLLWMEPHPKYAIRNFDDFWMKSCESHGALVTKILQEERKLWENYNSTKETFNFSGNSTNLYYYYFESIKNGNNNRMNCSNL